MKSLYGLGVGSLLAIGETKERRFPILLFHRVSPEPDSFYPPFPPEPFRELLRFFARRYRFLSIDRAADPESLPRNAAFITFDDAFRDFQDYALPILDELGLDSTVFVPTGSIDSGETIWPSLLDRHMEQAWNDASSFLEGPYGRIELRGIGTAEPERAAGIIKQRIMRSSYQEQMEWRRFLEGRGYSERIGPMDWEALRSLPESVRLGAHTVHHPYLPSLKESEIDREMHRSKERLEEELGKEVEIFAYPFGGYDERSRNLASKHFVRAFTTEPVPCSVSRSNDPSKRYELPRIDMLDTDPEEAFLRMKGLHNKVRRLIGPS